MTSMPWCATSAPKASTSATSPPHAAGPTGAGSDPGSSAQSPGDHTGTDVITTISTTSAAATGDTEERDTRPERMRTATTEPNNTTSAMPRC